MHPAISAALLAEEAYCRAHPDYFVERHCNIEDKDSATLLVPFRLWPMQRQALLELHEHRLNIILKARQLGITWLALAYAAYVLRFTPGSTVVALSRTEEEAKELVRRAGVLLGNMPALLRETPWEGPTWRASAMSAVVSHPDGRESVLKAFPAAMGASRSFTANLVILDEWAFQQFAREIWTAAFPTINRPTGGKVIGLSTIRRGTLFEDLWTAEDTGFHKIFLPWQADPRRTPAWYEQSCKALGDLVLSEYPATPEEALTIPGGAYFPELKPEIHLTDHMPAGNVKYYLSIDYGLDALAALWYAVDARGDAVVYRELYRSGLIVSEAAQAIAACSTGEPVTARFAPPDLWNRNRDTGRSTQEIFAACGLPLAMTSNDRVQGWLDVKEWLRPFDAVHEQTGQPYRTARLRLLEGAAPNLWRCLRAIQKDERRPVDCATEPHELTHLPDSLRAFCAGRPCAPRVPARVEPKPFDPLATRRRVRGNFDF